jgi:hypothetical protein
MRKKSKYKQKPVFVNPVAYAVEGSKLLSEEHPQYLTELKIKNHAAMLALTRGEANKQDMDCLIQMYNIMDAFRILGIGGIEREIHTTGQSISSIASRPKFIATGPELTAINTLMDYHDELFDHITVRQLEMAVREIRKTINAGKAEKLGVKK